MLFAGLFGAAMCVLRKMCRGSVVWIVAVHFVADVILMGGVCGVWT
ncbi:hypothetical protein [Clavibacter sp. CFBP 8614]